MGRQKEKTTNAVSREIFRKNDFASIDSSVRST
jgi:hypothetical protein